MENKVKAADTPTTIKPVKEHFNMSVSITRNDHRTPKNAPETPQTISKKAKSTENDLQTPKTAILEATVYKEDGSFIPHCNYLFEALDADNNPLNFADVDEFKQAVDRYFAEVVNTEYYVKSIPKASSLCHIEMQAFNY